MHVGDMLTLQAPDLDGVVHAAGQELVWIMRMKVLQLQVAITQHVEGAAHGHSGDIHRVWPCRPESRRIVVGRFAAC